MIVPTNSGPIQGNEDRGVAVFKGVPYAAPPIGPLRFAPPQPAAAWTSVRDATEHGPIAPQTPSRLRAAMGDSSPREQSEDCLTLSIWAPARAEACPVLVWLHGGAWTSGAGSLDWYDGSTLARDGGMIVVGVNYRLGAFGYLCHPAISAEDLGTLDQVLALQWVHDNIAAFGGDPARVTVGGQSAGAANIGRLALHPAARPLFHRAILQSGGFGRTPLARPEAEESSAVFIRSLGIDPDAPDMLSQLRALPTAAILDAQGAFARSRARFGDSSPPFVPVLATPMTEAGLLNAIAAAMGPADILIGATHDEAHAFFAGEPADPAEGALEALFARIGGPDETVARYAARRPGGSQTDLLSDFSTQHTFLQPTMRLAAAMAGHGANVFAYQFNWSPPYSRFKACHCIELPFVFGTFDAWFEAPMLAGGDPDIMAALSETIRDSWTAFIHAGDPSLPDLPWPRYTADARATMLLDDVCEIIGGAPSLRSPAG